MRIALVSDCYLPEVNGITFCVQNLWRELSKNNSVSLAVPSYGINDSLTRFASIRVPLDLLTQLVWPNIFKMNRVMTAVKPEVIHVHTLGVLGLMAVWWGRKNKTPVVLTYHTLVAGTLASYPAFKAVGRITEWAMWKYSQIVCNWASVVIAPAEAIRELLLEHGVKKRVVTVNNGVETKTFKTNQSYMSYKTNTIIYVGRIGYEKGVDVIVEAMKAIPEVELVLIGEGDAKLDLPKNVKLMGKVDRARLPEEYAKAKLFVTAAQFEVNPLVVLEAMACGLPVIGANKGGMAKGPVVNGRNGFLVDEVNPEAFAAKIKVLIVDDKLRDKMSRAARKTAEEHDVTQMVSRTLEVYRSQVDNS